MKKVKPSQILIGLFTLVGVVFGVLALLKLGKKKELEGEYESKVSTLEGMYAHGKREYSKYIGQINHEFPGLEPSELEQIHRYASAKEMPSPTLENQKAAEANYLALKNTRISHEQDLMGGEKLGMNNPEAPNFELTVQTGIRNYALKMRQLATVPKTPIRWDKDGAIHDFGFTNYVSQSVNTNNPELARALDKQRAILDYLVSRLMQSEPIEVIAVRRENVESKFNSTIQPSSTDVFYLDSKVSARVEGAIETYAFLLEFSGYTDSLRKFFKELAKFEIPVVVRDVKVARKLTEDIEEDEEEVDEPAMVPGEPGNPFPPTSPFPVAGSAPPTPTAPPIPLATEPDHEVVVDKNVSIFTVTIEFVELAKQDENIDQEDADD